MVIEDRECKSYAESNLSTTVIKQQPILPVVGDVPNGTLQPVQSARWLCFHDVPHH